MRLVPERIDFDSEHLDDLNEGFEFHLDRLDIRLENRVRLVRGSYGTDFRVGGLEPILDPFDGVIGTLHCHQRNVTASVTAGKVSVTAEKFRRRPRMAGARRHCEANRGRSDLSEHEYDSGTVEEREELLTVREAADWLKLNQQTLRNMIDRGELRAVRVGSRRVRIRRSDLERFLAAGEAPGRDGDAGRDDLSDALRAALRAADGHDPAELAAALRSLAAAAERLASELDRA